MAKKKKQRRGQFFGGGRKYSFAFSKVGKESSIFSPAFLGREMYVGSKNIIETS